MRECLMSEQFAEEIPLMGSGERAGCGGDAVGLRRTDGAEV